MKPHKSKASQARSVKKKAATHQKLKKKTKISKAAKPNIKKSTLTKASKSSKKQLKKVITTTKKTAKKIDQVKKAKPSKVKETLKKAKKSLSQTKSKVTHKVSQKVTKKPLKALPKKHKQDTSKKVSLPTKTLIASKPKTEPKSDVSNLESKSSQQKKKEIFYDAVEAAFHDEQVVLTNAEGKQFCYHKECDQVATTDIYCRHHYVLLWKLIQCKKKILEGGKLEKFIQEVSSRYPDKFLDMIRKNLSTERDFTTTLQELEIADTSDYQDSHKDSTLEDDHLPFSEERPET